MRDARRALAADLSAAGIPLQPFEGWRPAQRQADLYIQDRVPSWKGNPNVHVTFSRPWIGRHVYGLADDWVYLVNGNWTWTEPEKGMWDEFDKRAEAVGLESVKFERPHVQLAGIKLSDLLAGKYPDGGDSSWANNLAHEVNTWGRSPKIVVVEGVEFKWMGAPPVPATNVMAPPVPAAVPTTDPHVLSPGRAWEVPPDYLFDEEQAMCVAVPRQ
jgi:peptidoglycan L-alanyl-D-glutamate endopeptidase CwlK